MKVLSVSTFALMAVSAFSFAPAPGRRYPTALAAMTPLSANGKKLEFPEGSSLMAACTKLGLKVPTNCKKGDCGTCSVKVGGSVLRACQAKVPPAPRLKSVAEKGLPVVLAR
ncbi:hypothetical protein M885DRAFT_506357 [Pelagophyceae sp. CCMP2097]|nr:hypothetical protein M885DRAFT_506357 [Pelagophyceae sp. CCMP2097]|mmetsp:Transcript_22698/g.76691  ORF Transcript_22698/g.76691 Transcript_22698/m.76691 type:complete len:112 (-) Transcript_22698:114-449(-)|eukprot:CAMPEP_0184106402 /NCGR_PEP_ID=MMETSP0974-20121125/15360_1 /TAXON_ID=483370 /ORGANISM="non described non described, Strain CCMP2097" /LENGTH=111 /DNA_ID=CAMNT_0026409421 /DNA_START=67 /DNA_END=402 /DNA_ORIENTATION=+